MDLFPIYLKLEGRRVVIVGAGRVGLEKIQSLLSSGALIHVIAPEAIQEVRDLVASGAVSWSPKAFQPEDVSLCFMVVAATNDPAVNRSVYEAAQKRRVLSNSADDPPNCDFYFSSIVRRGQLQIAISTAGESPALAQQLRREIEASLPPHLGDELAALGSLRREILSTHPRGESRKRLLHLLASRPVCEKPDCPTRELALQAAASPAGAER